MWPSHHWECQAHLALLQLPSESSGHWLGHALGVLCHPGTSAPLTGCSLLCTARASRLLFHICSSTEARRDWTEEEQEKEVTFFGKKSSCFWTCIRRNHPSHPHRDRLLGIFWSHKTSCSFASNGAGPRGRAKEKSSERQDWEAKISWERDWQ